MSYDSSLQTAASEADLNVATAVSANEAIMTAARAPGGATRHPAGVTAGGVKGGRAVAQAIGVRLDADYRISDAEIRAAAIDRLACDESAPHHSVQVAVANGWITLTGHVDWYYQREAIEQRLRRLPGVVGVSNEMHLRADSAAADSNVRSGIHGSWFFEPKTAAARPFG